MAIKNFSCVPIDTPVAGTEKSYHSVWTKAAFAVAQGVPRVLFESIGKLIVK
ncbi:MAG TPA: hypothetical protein VNY09_06250 [Candidatus Sulfotelmatobacter sp.]|nr:hypothetical protein [Candidatus Sulfotelmatobacter sp.]